ncbi:hypothetical protein M9Y10_013960 [Tritrichomonas musculus]|uniref:Ubiquitin-like domain-containing protein n=1 Tax=Tritrichomonas musculus TaxID=1915356 RepID=A0ABR2KY91_9EUKA
MLIHISFQYGRLLHIEVQPMDTVKDLKKYINSSLEYSLKHMDLIYRGKILENDEMLSHYSIHEDSTVHILPLGVGN